MPSYTPGQIRELVTPRLRLQPVCEADAEHIQRLFPNPNVLRYMATAIPQPYPADGAISFVRRSLTAMEAHDEYHWSINFESQLIGAIGLSPASNEDSRGFWLDEEFWGRGLMKEAVVAVNDFAFDELEMDFMLLNNAQPNVASGRLKQSMGAELLPVDEKDFIGGRFLSERWKLTAEAWRKYRAEHP